MTLNSARVKAREKPDLCVSDSNKAFMTLSCLPTTCRSPLGRSKKAMLVCRGALTLLAVE